ncbi:MAG: NUDIX hydrolase [Chloroflexota bacterium]
MGAGELSDSSAQMPRMLQHLPPDIQAEIDDLSQQFGVPVFHLAQLNSEAFWQREREREVCMVIRRKSGLLIAFKKTFYPPETFRLLTGGVENGERILDALLREVNEETGLNVDVSRFLATVAYRPEGVGEGAPNFYTFAFLLEERSGTLGAIDPEERVEAFREILPTKLLGLALHLGNLPDSEAHRLGERWAEWGRFRAVIHRVVYEILAA